MSIKTLTSKQYERGLQRARYKHDSKYRVDNPKPQPEQYGGELTLLERLVGGLWIVWAILGLAGAFISLPHTLRTLLPTVDLSPALALAYSLVVFLGVELALIGVALASELKRSEEERERPKQASLAGAINTAALRMGLKPPVDTTHLPERRPATGGLLVGLLFLAALSFNLADTLRDVGLLARYVEEIHTTARIMAGTLGPGLLLIAGHRFAQETVRAASGRKSREGQYQQSLLVWEAGLQESWQEEGPQWIGASLASAWRARNPGAPDALNPYLEPEEPEQPLPFPSSSSGNGHRERERQAP
jgi:hypothetical protein